MQITNTMDKSQKPSLIMLVYGEGGVGKTTFGATAPSPILADCEGGAKYFGLRGINLDVAQIQSWEDMREFYVQVAKTDKYQTIIIDPIGELMEKLKRFMIAQNNKKLVQADGSPSMAGWGYLKDTMRNMLKAIKDSGKNVLIIAHVDEKMDEERMVKRPLIMTKISDEIVNMVDVVGYFTTVLQDGDTKRIIIVDPGSDKFVAKDRTGQLGKIIEPDFSKIVLACNGSESYSWSKKTDEKLAVDITKDNLETKKKELADKIKIT